MSARRPDQPEDPDAHGRDPYLSHVAPDERAADRGGGGSPTAWGVVAGIVLGFLVSFAFPLFLAAVFPPEWGLTAAILLPAAIGVAVLLVPRWRRNGAGFVMGLAIGAIIFAGVCGAFLATLNA